MTTAVDSFLLLSFGGPQGPDEVLPFLRNVTAGRGVPDERLAEVAEHYHHFGGVSPITAQNQALLAALAAEFGRRGIDLPLYFGNRNWHPLLTDTARQMAADGRRHALVLATSATGSYSGCRQYREDLARALAEVGPDAGLRFTKLRHYFDHPGFVAANADAVRAALAELPAELRDEARLVFTAHSVPVSMNDTAGPDGGLYLAQHRETARLVAEAVRGPGAEFDLVWQSRSGPPQVPWLEPDVNDHLRALAAAGVRGGAGGADRLRLRPPRGAVGPRQRGPRDRRGAGPAVRPGRPPPAPTRRSSPGWWTWSPSSSPAGRRPTSAGWGLRSATARPTCCPAPVRRPAGHGSAGRLRSSAAAL